VKKRNIEYPTRNVEFLSAGQATPGSAGVGKKDERKEKPPPRGTGAKSKQIRATT
jgi:hypothetical protein